MQTKVLFYFHIQLLNKQLFMYCNTSENKIITNSLQKFDFQYKLKQKLKTNEYQKDQKEKWGFWYKTRYYDHFHDNVWVTHFRSKSLWR